MNLVKQALLSSLILAVLLSAQMLKAEVLAVVIQPVQPIQTVTPTQTSSVSTTQPVATPVSSTESQTVTTPISPITPIDTISFLQNNTAVSIPTVTAVPPMGEVSSLISPTESMKQENNSGPVAAFMQVTVTSSDSENSNQMNGTVVMPPLPPLVPVPIEPGSFPLNQPQSERVVVQSPVILEKPEIGTESEEPVFIPIDLGRELQTLMPVGNAIEQQNDFRFSGNAAAGSSSAVDVFSPGATFEATFSVAPHKQSESSSEVSAAVTQVNPIPAPQPNDVDAFLVAAQTIGFQSFLRGAVTSQSPNSTSSSVVFGSSDSRKDKPRRDDDKDEKIKRSSRFQSQFSDLILKPVSKSKKQS